MDRICNASDFQVFDFLTCLYEILNTNFTSLSYLSVFVDDFGLRRNLTLQEQEPAPPVKTLSETFFQYNFWIHMFRD